MFDRWLHRRSLSSIGLYGIVLLALFVLLFSILAVFEEYHDFESDTDYLRHRHLREQKAQMVEKIGRVETFITTKYAMFEGSDPAPLQREIVDSVELMGSDPNISGYVDLYTFDGRRVADLFREADRDVSAMWEGAHGKKILADLVATGRKEGGGFVEFPCLREPLRDPVPKISYAKAFEPWRWVMVTGVYLDEIEAVIVQKRAALKKRLIKHMMETLTLAFILFGFALGGGNIILRIIEREINIFNEFFKEAATRYHVIEKRQVHFAEFQTMVDYANAMVKTIHRHAKELERFNAELEARVANKTQKLREQNRELESQKAFNEALVQAQDEFIRHSIHEVNTPLSVMITHIDLFRMRYGENGYMDKIEAAATMLHNIYNDLSYLVKKDRVPYPERMIELGEFVGRRIDFFADVARAGDIAFDVSLQPNLSVKFNEIKLQRIIDNNLSNAVKYAYAGTQAVISVEACGDKVIFSVKTRSKKIEDVSKIFEAYYREGRLGQGFGLGLNLVKSICEEMGVAASVQSDDLYTTFSYGFNAYGEEHENTAS